MKPETARDLLIPYLDGELDPQTAGLLERHLAADPVLARELAQLRVLQADIAASPPLEPDPGMRTRFEALLASEKARAEAGRAELDDDEPDAGPRPARLLAFPVWLSRGVAAAALLGVGVGIGWGIARQPLPPSETPRSGSGVPPATVAELSSLRQEVAVMRELLTRAPAAQQSASYRLQAVSYASELTSPDAVVIDALFSTLLHDPSGNVRLAALEGLSRFKSDPDVRSRLAAALARQTDPLVQIGLIGTLVEAGAAEAREPMEELLLRPDVAPIVKGQAQQALTRL